MSNLVRRDVNKPKTIWDELFDANLDTMFSLVPRQVFRSPELFMSNEWLPKVDVRETEELLVFDAELPGMKEDEIELSVEDNVLTIKGDRKFEKEEKKGNYHRVERQYGSFQRSFSLPNNVEQDQVKAVFKDGVLEVQFPKKPETQPKKVKIEIGK